MAEDIHVDSEKSFGVGSVSVDGATGRVSLDFKLHRSLFGVEGSLDVAKATDLIAQRLEDAYNKVLNSLN